LATGLDAGAYGFDRHALAGVEAREDLDQAFARRFP
jgi:hypothetical protein